MLSLISFTVSNILTSLQLLGLFPVNEDRSYLMPKEYVAIEPHLEVRQCLLVFYVI